MAETVKIGDVKPVSFTGFLISEDGKSVVFQLNQAGPKTAHIMVPFERLGFVAALVAQAATRAEEVRAKLDLPTHLTGSEKLEPQLVSGFQVLSYPDQGVHVLSLRTPTGFRSDYAISRDAKDQRGRSLAQGIADELVAAQNGKLSGTRQ